MIRLYIKPSTSLKYDYSDKANHVDDSGLDLYVQNDIICASHTVTFIGYGIYCEMVDIKKDEFLDRYVQKNIAYLLVPRSSISKTPLMMANSIGIIDAGYRGEIISAVYNTDRMDYTVKSGTRLFQIVAPSLTPFSIELVTELSDSIRGRGGFGSTNISTNNIGG